MVAAAMAAQTIIDGDGFANYDMVIAFFIAEAFFTGEGVETELYAKSTATLGASVVFFIGEVFHIGYVVWSPPMFFMDVFFVGVVACRPKEFVRAVP